MVGQGRRLSLTRYSYLQWRTTTLITIPTVTITITTMAATRTRTVWRPTRIAGT